MSISQAKALYIEGIIEYNHGHFTNPNGIISSDNPYQRVIKSLLESLSENKIHIVPCYHFTYHY